MLVIEIAPVCDAGSVGTKYGAVKCDEAGNGRSTEQSKIGQHRLGGHKQNAGSFPHRSLKVPTVQCGL